MAGFIDGGIHVKKYLLQDEFTTDLAAGSVNGTAAEPGPGTRTVVDNESKLSIVGGKLTFAGGKAVPGYGDPSLWGTAFARQAGKMVPYEFNTASGIFVSGLDTNQAGEAVTGLNPFNGNFVVYLGTQIGTYSYNTSYKYSLICRSTGYFHFLKDTVWRLMYVEASGADATLYPNVNVYNAVVTCDFLHIPTYLYLPTPLASDGFGSAFGTTDGLGHAEGIAGGIGAGGGGLTWTGPTWSTSGGNALNTPTVGAEKCNDTGFADALQWTDSGITFVVAGGVATGTLTSDTLTNTGGSAAAVDTWYKLTATITRTAGSVQMGMGGGNGLAISASGTYTQTVRATTTGKPILTGTGFTGTVDNFSVKPLTLSELFASVSPSPATADVYTSVDLTLPVVTNACQGGIVMNLDSTSNPQNFVQAHYTRSTGKVMLVKMVGGVYAADILNVTATYAAGAKLVCRKIGTSYYVWYNNVYIGAATISDAGIISNTLHGVFSTDASGTLDNFVVYASGSGGEYAILGNF